MTYPAMPWVVILVVSMIYRVFVLRTKINKYLEGQTSILVLVSARSRKSLQAPVKLRQVGA